MRYLKFDRFCSRKAFLSLRLALLALLFLSPGFALEILVPGDYSTIQGAIDAANPGDEIIVSPGTYAENINFLGKDIILRSIDPLSPFSVQSTIIDGNESGSVVTFSGNETSNCVMAGFTITNGKISDYGGGINGNGCTARIENNTIINNATKTGADGGYGGGLFSCNGDIRHNTIRDNQAKDGGGLHSCHGLIEDNIISYNKAYYFGGGVAFSNGIIRNNTIQENKVTYSGGGVAHSNGLIRGNKIQFNEGGIYYSGAAILNNTIESNYGTGLAYCYGSIRYNYISSNIGVGIAHSSGPIINNVIQYNNIGVSNCSSLIKENAIQNNQSYGNGGGILLCSGDIENNVIQNNFAVESGGGISDCSGAIRGNIIQQNSAGADGGGLYRCNGGEISFNDILYNLADKNGGGLYDCENIVNNYIYYNRGSDAGGGLSHCGGAIKNNRIQNNVASFAGGLFKCNGPISNNVIINNTSFAIGGVGYCEGIITNCIIWANHASLDPQIAFSSVPSFSCIQDWTEGGEGNIDLDPLFLDQTNGDFHLQEGSPCIDAGHPDSEYNDSCLPPGKGTSRNDMGAYGGPDNCETTFPSLQPALADLTEYGDVWAANNSGAPPFETPARRGWLGFRFAPENGWYALKGNADAFGIEDVIQITEYGDAWVALSREDSFSTPSRWGWLGFRYEEKTGNGWIPLSGDVDGTGSDDLIQVTEYGDAWVALSTETMYSPPSRWGWLGYRFKRGEPGENGAIPLAGDADGDGLCDLIQITEYTDVWVALSTETMYSPPSRWGWLGFKYAPSDGWLPLCADVNGDGADDLIQITPNGDPWVSLSTKSSYAAPTRWGWLNFFYDEEQGYYPLMGDVNMDGKADLIQITPSGEAWVAYSTGTSFDYPEYWGAPRFLFDRQKGYLPFYLGY